MSQIDCLNQRGHEARKSLWNPCLLHPGVHVKILCIWGETYVCCTDRSIGEWHRGILGMEVQGSDSHSNYVCKWVRGLLAATVVDNADRCGQRLLCHRVVRNVVNWYWCNITEPLNKCSAFLFFNYPVVQFQEMRNLSQMNGHRSCTFGTDSVVG